MKIIIRLGLILVLGLGVLGAFKYVQSPSGQTVSFRTVPVTRGDLVASIDATGTVEPEKVINVGAQVAGQIVSFGTDAAGKAIDYGSAVEEGTVLAQIDDALFRADVDEAKVQVQSAKAGIQRAQADLSQLKAKFEQAQSDWDRAQKVESSRALAQISYDAYKYSYAIAKANVAVGEAALLQAQATLAQAQTNLWRAQRNLSYCTIKSPIKGIIIDRRVNIGQTVVSSMSAPSLFLLAKDLKRMLVWAAVNEADIGKIHPGQRVTFTVDAFPGETFVGAVWKIRLNACMTQNVVTYTVEITTDNSSGRLLPYLTAEVQFELARRNDVLQVPNTALRWTPSASQVAPEFRSRIENPTAQQKKQATVWVLENSYVRPVDVEIGLTNGVMTEIRGKELCEGLEVVTGLEMTPTAAETSAATTTSTSESANNPFAPKLPPPPKGGPPPR